MLAGRLCGLAVMTDSRERHVDGLYKCYTNHLAAKQVACCRPHAQQKQQPQLAVYSLTAQGESGPHVDMQG